MQAIRFKPNFFEEVEHWAVPESLTPWMAADAPHFWINIHGLQDKTAIRQLGTALNLPHPLIEDLLDVTQRPTLEEYTGLLFFSLKSIERQKGTRIELEQISFVLTAKGLVSIQEKPADLFGRIRDRLRTGKGVLRDKSSDYLLYALLDAVLLPYNDSMTRIEQVIVQLEEEALHSPNKRVLASAQSLKRDLMMLQRAVHPLRDAVNSLEKGVSPLILSENASYFRDLRDNVMDLFERLESHRFLLESVEQLYMSSLNQKTNEVIRVLTIFSTVFMPLTFLVGVYGMNFKVMPEIDWEYGYYTVWGVMILLVVAMLRWMRLKRWL